MQIKQAWEASGLTQERLAEFTEVTAQYLSGVERGTVGLSVPVLLRRCSILNVSSDFLLMGGMEFSDAIGITTRLSGLTSAHIKNVEEILNCYMEGIAIAQHTTDNDRQAD